MSLINEALKKAQKQRTGETPEMPAVGGESAARIARRGQPAGLNSLILRIGLGVAALAVVIVGAALVLRRPAAPVPPAGPATAATTPATTAPAVAPSSVASVPASTPGATAEAPAAVVVPAPVTGSASVGSTTAPLATTVVFPSAETPKPAETAPIQLAPAPAQPTAPAVARKLEPRAVNFINSIRVAGIRASANDSKVLMMDRVYRVGDLVEAEMGLKLAGITPTSLTFEDENGARFTRNF